MHTHTADASNCPTGSVRDYFFNASYGQLTVNSTVTDWIDVSSTEIMSGSSDSKYAFSPIAYNQGLLPLPPHRTHKLLV